MIKNHTELSEIDDVEGLAKNLNTVLGDNALRARLITGGTHTYETHFFKEIVISKLLQAYKEIIHRGIPA